jgi:hypothetical protein
VDWSAASINLALAPADRLYTGDNGRAEIQFDDGSVLRIAERTDVEVLSLREELIQLRILTGLCSLTVHSSTSFEIDTPAAAFNTQKKGIYRFDVTDNGDTDGIVRKGRMEAANNGFSRNIDSGELIHIMPGGNGTPLMSRFDSRDAWDDWTDRRDVEQVASDTRRYIPDNVYMGAHELDQYGRWVAVDSYGPAWVPYNVDAGWSPYWVGRWCYRPYWGWTWVSYEPWGWLPYHYGRWYFSGSYGWCWLPGPSFGFHFWSPGLVRFYMGPTWVSWCPLGPGDYYNVNQYWYNSTYNYQINNVRLVQNRAPDDLVNRNVPGAFRTVPTNGFVGSSFSGTMRSMPVERVEQPWRQGRMITDRLDVAPGARSYAPVPDKPTVRPTNVNALPPVVRSVPTDVANSEQGRFVRIGSGAGAVVSAPVTSGRNTPGSPISAGRGGSATAGDSTEGPSTVRPNRTNPARVYRLPNPGSPGRQPQPSQSLIENQRSKAREIPRPEPAAPPRRMENQPMQRNDRPAQPPRPETEKPRSAPHPSGSSNYSPPEGLKVPSLEYGNRPDSGAERTAQVGSWQGNLAARPAPFPAINPGRSLSGGSWPAPFTAAPGMAVGGRVGSIPPQSAPPPAVSPGNGHR